MTFDGSVTLQWGGKARRFRLPIKQLSDLSEERKLGPEEIAARLAPLEPPRYWPEDIRATLRLGLIGGGTSPTEAEVLCALHVDRQPLAWNRAAAFEVIAAALVGPTDARVASKKKAAAAAALSTSDGFTSSAVLSDGTLGSSTI